MAKLKRKPDGLGEGKTYLGKVPVPARAELAIGNPDGIKPADVMVRLKPKEVQFLEAYARTGTGAQAMLSLFPKMNYHAAHRKANRWMKKVDAVITPEEKFALMGITTGKLARVVSEAMDARFQKEFVTRDGFIVHGPEHDDHQVRLEAAKFGAKLLGIDKENNNPTISINLVQFAPPGSAPWPTSGAASPEIDITPGGPEEI